MGARLQGQWCTLSGTILLFLPQGSCWEQPFGLCSPTTAHQFPSPQVLRESTAELWMLLWSSKPSWKEPQAQTKMRGAELSPSQESGLGWAKYCQAQLSPALGEWAAQCGQSGLWGVVSHCFLLSWAQRQGEPATENMSYHDCPPQRSCRIKSRGEHPLCVKHLGFCLFLSLISSLLCISHSIAVRFQ